MSFEVIVIGGNFAGLSAAMQLARARRRVLLIDAGAPRNRFSQASHGFLGQDGQTPAAIMREGKRQLSLYPTVSIRDGALCFQQRNALTCSGAPNDDARAPCGTPDDGDASQQKPERRKKMPCQRPIRREQPFS